MIQNKRGLLPLLFLFLSAIATASPEARFHLLKMDYKLNEDGSQEFHFRKELSIYTHPAMNNTYGETFIVYNPEFQTLTINESYTKQSDGTIIKNPENAFVKQLPSAAARAPYYNQITEMAVVHTGLDLGCTIYLDYTISSKPGYLPELDVYLPIEERAPIDQCEITIDIPTSRTLQFQSYGNFTSSKKEEQGNRTVYSWQLKNLAEPLPEPYAPISTALIASTWKDTNEAINYIGTQCAQNMPAQLPAELKAALDTCASTQARVASITDFVQSHVETCKLPLADCGYRIRPCQDVLTTAYGTVPEKASLLYGLLKSYGINAAISLESELPTALIDKTPALSTVSNIKVRIKDGAKVLEVNPSTGKIHTVLTEETGVQIAQYPLGSEIKATASSASYRKDYQLTLDANGKISSEGELPPTAADSSMKQFQTLTFLLPDDAASKALTLFASHRTRPVLLPTPIDEELTYTLTLPAGWELRNEGEKAQVENSVGKVEIRIESEGNKAILHRSLKINATEIPVKQYVELSQLLTLWHDTKLSTLLLAH
ncbi:MAG: DUF3857 domain-containing protein [Bacteroidaceae bacterium]|jgi:hypothetical protein